MGFGMVVNLSRETINMCVLLGGLLMEPNLFRVCEGSIVVSSGRLIAIFCGEFLVGCLLDALGQIVICIFNLTSTAKWVLESPSPGILDRCSVFEPLQSGIICVDALVPLGLGQRELIVGDRQTGKTCLGVDSILNQKYTCTVSVFVPLGLKGSGIVEVFLGLVRRDALFFVSLVASGSSSSAVCQFLCAYTGSSVCE